MDRNGKSTDALMRHIRSHHNIEISGSRDKKDLLAMGYFHGYKAYRFLRTKNNKFDFKNFNEIKSIYDFDNSLKTIFYPVVMQFETILKNYTIDELVSNGPADVNAILKYALTYDQEVKDKPYEYKKAMDRKLRLKMKINSTIYHSYKSSHAIQHYLNNGESIPIWALFENMTLGDYGTFIQCLNSDIRINIESNIGIINLSRDTNGLMLSKNIFIVKDLRNAIAHNNIVFDCRFKQFDVRKTISKFLEYSTDVKNIKFNSIIDYLILLMFYYKNLKTPVDKMKRSIKDFEIATKNLRNGVSFSIYQKILGSDVNNKINQLLEYVKK